MTRTPPFEQPLVKFENRVAVVTGAGGNIGSAICKMLAEHGVKVAATDVCVETLSERIKQLGCTGAEIRPYGLDVTDAGSVRDAFGRIVADFGKIDILVNNAGVWIHRDVKEPRRIEDVPVAEWRRIFAVNVEGTINCLQVVLPHMAGNEYGRIVNLGSIAGEVGLPGRADYSACKAAVIGLTKTVAMENAKRGITVNCVSPGWINRKEDGGVQPCDGTWMGWSGDASDIARAVVFLASDSAWYMTGVDVPVDGGRILGPHNSDMA